MARRRYTHNGRPLPKWAFDEIVKRDGVNRDLAGRAIAAKNEADRERTNARLAGDGFKRAIQEGLDQWFRHHFETSDVATDYVRVWERLRDDISARLVQNIETRRLPDDPLGDRDSVHHIEVHIPDVRFRFALHRGLDRRPI